MREAGKAPTPARPESARVAGAAIADSGTRAVEARGSAREQDKERHASHPKRVLRDD